MAVGETLLKITDFPFAYSIILIVFGIWGISIQNESLVVLIGTAGALGTFLTITDPIGWGIKKRLKVELLKKIGVEKDKSVVEKLKNSIDATDTRSIGIEVDKLVSMGYFIFLLLIFGWVISNTDMAERIQLKNVDDNVIFDADYMRILGQFISFPAAFIVFIIGRRRWNRLKSFVETASIQRIGIGSEYVTENTISNMTRATEANDWATANKWAAKIELEIRIKKGKKEQIITSVDEVYRPLYMENMANEGLGKGMKRMGDFRSFQRDEWLKIKSTTAHLRIEDVVLKTELESFYENIRIYNDLANVIIKICEEIVRQRTTEFYGQDKMVFYFVKSVIGSGAPSLAHVLPFGRHPLDQYPKEQSPTRDYIQIQTRGDGTIKELRSDSDYEKFDKFFEQMSEDANKNPTIIQARKRYDEIIKKNEELREQIVSEIITAFQI